MGQSEGSPEREVCNNTGLPVKIENFQINNLTLHLQELEATTTKKAQSELKEGVNQDQSRIK